MMNNEKITLDTMSKRLNLSVSTISRVLNGKAEKYRISKETEQQVIDAVDKFKYVPNVIARSLKSDKTMMIGVIIPDIVNPFFSTIAKLVEDISRKNGYSIIFCDSQESEEIEEHSLTIMRNRRVDGLIIAPVGISFNKIKNFQQSGIPIVVIDRYFKDSDLPFISSDNYQGAYDAVEYMINQGHKRIAIIKGLNGTIPNQERVRGFIDAMNENGIMVNDEFVVGDNFSEQNGYLETKLLMQHKNPPTAILATSNLISLGVMRACADVGLKIPHDLSIVAFDEQPYSKFLKTPMTTIEQNKMEIGYAAMKLLLHQINNNNTSFSNNLILPTILIKRKSVRNLRKG